LPPGSDWNPRAPRLAWMA